MYITLALLRKLGACSEQVDLFLSFRPSGRCKLTYRNLKVAWAEDLDIWWLLHRIVKSKPMDGLQAQYGREYTAVREQHVKGFNYPDWDALEKEIDVFENTRQWAIVMEHLDRHGLDAIYVRYHEFMQ